MDIGSKDKDIYTENETIEYNDLSDLPDEVEELSPETAFNLDVTPSPLYPRLYIGNSAEHLPGEFNESGYVDENVGRTWTGLLNNIYG